MHHLCTLAICIHIQTTIKQNLPPPLSGWKECQMSKQAGAELGQAQLKLELDLILTVCSFGLSTFDLIVMIGLILFCRFD